jgi:inorganic triphosphatase YgiF
MSVHTILEARIKELEAIKRSETERKILDQLPTLTRTLDRTSHGGLHLAHSMELVRQLFQQEPVCNLQEFHTFLQKPLGSLATPAEVFAKSQADLTAFQAQLEDTREQFQNLAEQVDQQFDDLKHQLNQEMETVRGLLKIPELLPGHTNADQAEQVLDEMDKILKGAKSAVNLSVRLKTTSTKNLKDLANRWQPLYVTFTNIHQRLSFDTLQEPPYQLSPSTIEVIKSLVSGQSLTFDKLTPEVVAELHQNFKQFLSQIVLRFTA